MNFLIRICNRIPLFFWFLLIGILYYVQISQNLFVCDDLGYAMTKDGLPISNIGDIISTQISHYQTTNGRFLVHCVVMLFAGVLGMEAFRICSAVAFMLVVYELYLLCDRRYKALLPVIILLVMLLLPSFNTTFLGNIATVTNYLWTSVFFLVYLIGIEKVCKQSFSSSIVVFWSILAFFSGALQESFSMGCAVGSVLVVWQRRKCVPKGLLPIVLCYCIGTAFVVLAPANFSREMHTNEGGALWYRVVSNTARVISKGYAFLGLGCLLFYSWKKDRQKARDFIIQNILLVSVIVVSLSFASCIAFIGHHQLTGAYLCTIVLMFRWIRFVGDDSCAKCRYWISMISALVLFVLYPLIFHYRVEVSAAYEKMYDSAANAKDGVFYSQEYDSLSYRNMNWVQEHFTSSELNQDFPLRSASIYFSEGANPELLTTRLPYSKESIIAMCVPQNKVSELVFHQPETLVYVFSLPNLIESGMLSFRVGQRNSTLGCIRNRLTHQESPNIAISERCLDELPSFKDAENTYYVLKFKEEFPVTFAEVKL